MPRPHTLPLFPYTTLFRSFRYTSWGESHGPAIGVVVDGVPPRIPLAESDIQHWLDRRRPGQSRYTTQRREPDEVKILSGVLDRKSTRLNSSHVSISYAVFC